MEEDEVEVEVEGIEEFEIEDEDGEGGPAVTTTASAFVSKATVTAASKPKLVGKGLDEPKKAVPLEYSSAGEDGEVQTSRAAGANPDDKRTYPGTGRNEPCPCGSGKKYKVCHGRNEA
ncbi:SEC-C metal-binding domain-containing protein [Rarobacter incanus]|uniref:SEC-C metal-binding domain-containing protein n=1 Tax=Rarobacter incanus TaxID=153494 RepID=UPI003CCC689B